MYFFLAPVYPMSLVDVMMDGDGGSRGHSQGELVANKGRHDCSRTTTAAGDGSGRIVMNRMFVLRTDRGIPPD